MIKFSLILFFCIFFLTKLISENNTYSLGENLFKKGDIEGAKKKFEQDILFNPKNENSYLYLSKIFNKLDKVEEEENNLNTVLILNPENEEAIYHLALLKLKKSNYEDAKKLSDKLKKNCKKLCDKTNELNKKIPKSF